VIVLGVLIMVAGAALVIVGLYAFPRAPLWGGRSTTTSGLGLQDMLAAALVFAAGLFIGAAAIVLGQLLLVFLDVRARLVRIDRRLRDAGAAPKRESPMTERLRPR
jgi:hypothetical protein